ncbi:hypothetical protein N7474_005150 [Penicillium riverlandense]|uniref:uncharacterized protein n=1 Tax=Penicillium riverlandense TaxID=1903569 RepID=UPI002547803E|nr:uncharacterized protein N7474_005150 [Penicillium riverlandense]KAJ5819559.1 hypothetical protein N7474_005150 [Penicillium riverlandense]
MPSSSIILDLMAQHFLSGQHAAIGLSLVLFIFMFLPTLLVLVAVIVFFAFYYPQLHWSYAVDREYGEHSKSKQVEMRS